MPGTGEQNPDPDPDPEAQCLLHTPFTTRPAVRGLRINRAR